MASYNVGDLIMMVSSKNAESYLGTIIKVNQLDKDKEVYKVEWYLSEPHPDENYLKSDIDYQKWHIDCFRSYYKTYRDSVLREIK